MPTYIYPYSALYTPRASPVDVDMVIPFLSAARHLNSTQRRSYYAPASGVRGNKYMSSTPYN